MKGSQKAIVIEGLFEYPDAASAANPAIPPTNVDALDASDRTKLANWDATCTGKLEGLDAPKRKRKFMSMTISIRNCARKRAKATMQRPCGVKATFTDRYLEEQAPLALTEQFEDVPGQEERSGKKQKVSNMGRVKTGTATTSPLAATRATVRATWSAGAMASCS